MPLNPAIEIDSNSQNQLGKSTKSKQLKPFMKKVIFKIPLFFILILCGSIFGSPFSALGSEKASDDFKLLWVDGLQFRYKKNEIVLQVGGRLIVDPLFLDRKSGH